MPPRGLITSRAELATLWLPWCVARNEATVPIVHLPAEHPSARQLRVSDLDAVDARHALAWQPHRGETSWAWIERHAEAFGHAAAQGEAVALNDDAAVLEFDGVRMLREGCHRACGLYLSGVDQFELRAAMSPPFGPWERYRNAALRQR